MTCWLVRSCGNPLHLKRGETLNESLSKSLFTLHSEDSKPLLGRKLCKLWKDMWQLRLNFVVIMPTFQLGQLDFVRVIVPTFQWSCLIIFIRKNNAYYVLHNAKKSEKKKQQTVIGCVMLFTAFQILKSTAHHFLFHGYCSLGIRLQWKFR